MQNFAQSKVSRNTLGLQFAAMFEILLSLFKVSSVCQLCGKMNGSSKVRLIIQKNLFKMIDCLLDLLLSFVLAAKVEM